MSSSSMRIRYSSSTTSSRGGVGEDCILPFPQVPLTSQVPLTGFHRLHERAPETRSVWRKSVLKMRRKGAHVRAAGVSDFAAAEDRMEFLLTLRRRGIMDPDVLRAMEEVPRAVFVGEGFAAN